MRRALIAFALGLLPLSALAEDLTAWVNRYPSEMLADAEWRQRLQDVVGEAGLRRLIDDMGIEDQFALEEGWLMASGCAPHVCGEVMAGFAIALSDGRIVAVARDDQGVTVWGDAADLPVTLDEIAEQ